MFRSTFRSHRLHRYLHISRLSRADAKQAASKASDSASKASANVQEYTNKALEQSQKLAKVIGNTSGRLLQNAGPTVNGIVDRVVGLQRPIVYWGKVTGEIAKQVYLKEKMAPPSGAQFTETFEALRKQVAHPDRIFSKAMEFTNVAKLQELGWQPFARAGLRGLELFGFFCVGEMVGRRSIKGYQL